MGCWGNHYQQMLNRTSDICSPRCHGDVSWWVYSDSQSHSSTSCSIHLVQLSLYYVMQKETEGVRIMLLIFSSTTRSEPHGVNPPPPACSIRFPSFAVAGTSVPALRTATASGFGSSSISMRSATPTRRVDGRWRPS